MPAQTNPDLVIWAREQLQLDSSVPSDQARPAFLRRLSDEDFVPPTHLPYALAVLEGRARAPGSNEEGTLVEVIDRQRERIEEFAGRFFAIPIGERREQWLELKADCEGAPTLVHRLDRLEPGLELDPHRLEIADPKVHHLMREASKIFALAPLDAAVARAGFFRGDIDTSEAGIIRWGAAARDLQKTYPDYEILAPELIQQIIGWRTTAKLVTRQRKAWPDSRPGNRISKANRAAVVTTPAPETEKSNPPYYLIYVFIAIASALMIMARAHTPKPNNYSPNQYQNYDLQELLRKQNDDNDAALKSLLERKKLKPWEKGTLPSDNGKPDSKPPVIFVPNNQTPITMPKNKQGNPSGTSPP